MIGFLPYYHLKASVRQRHPNKVYAIDLGLRNIVSFTHSEDEGRLVETLVYQTLKRRFGDNIFYWNGKNEVDFVIKKGNKISQLWQVVADGLDEESVWKREIRALEEAKELFPDAEMFIVTKSLPKKRRKLPAEIIPLWVLLASKK